MKHRLFLSIAAFALVVLAGACSSGAPTSTATPTSEPAQATPTTAPTATPVPTPTAWPAPAFVVGTCPFALPSGVEEKCGTVAVPQDRSSDGSATFDLEVVVFASEADAPAPDPLVYLAGGPGENALDTLQFTFDDLFRPFLKARDVVVFDQRGAGYSEPGAECEELAALEIDLLDRSLSIDEESALGVAAAQACYDRLMSEGVALGALSTAESAAGVHAIMTALGYDEWNLLGISYGTRLAQTIMRDRPEGVRSVILDSVVPLEADIIAQTPGSFDRALQSLFDGCAASETCGVDYPDLEAMLRNAVEQLNDHPIHGVVTDQLTQEEFASVSDGADLATQLFQGLYSSDVIPLLPEMIALAAEGETGLLDMLRGASITNGAFVSTGMHLALQCTEEVPFTTEQRIREASESHALVREMLEGSRPMGSEMFDICNHWGLTPATSLENQPVTSAMPTLVLAGRYDPITPPSGGRQVADRLGNATFVEFPASGHAALMSGTCAVDIVAAFLADPGAVVDDACARNQGEFDWPRPLESTVFEQYADSSLGFTAVRPSGWSELAPGLFARSQLGVVTLLEQMVPGITGDQLVGVLRSSIPGSPEFLSFGAFTSAEYTWSLVKANVSGQILLLAFVDDAAATPFVMVTGLPSQEAVLLDSILGPVLEAFAPSF